MNYVVQIRSRRGGWQTLARVHKRVAAERIVQYARTDDHDNDRIRIIEVENALRLRNIQFAGAQLGV